MRREAKAEDVLKIGESVVAFERTRAEEELAGDEESVETPNEAAIM